MSHVMMKKSLAKALMDAGMENYDFGGQVGGGMFGGIGGAMAGGNIQTGISAPNLGDKTLSEQLGLANTFRANAPDIQRQNFMPRIQALQQQQGDVYGQQQSLANTLLAQSQQSLAQTPSVAQAQLAQATGANAAQQAAMMASQRGASANPALMARLAAQQGAQIQQGAAGQAATLMAQEQLARQQFDAQRQMQLQQMVQQQQQQMAAQGLQGEQIQQGGLASLNQAITQGELGAQQINAGVAGENMQQQRGLFGGIMGAGAKALGLGFADGGYVPKYACGGMAYNDGGKVPGKAEVQGDNLENDTKLALVSPGEIIIPRSIAMAEDAPKKAAEFVKHIKTKTSYKDVVDAKTQIPSYADGGQTGIFDKLKTNLGFNTPATSIRSTPESVPSAFQWLFSGAQKEETPQLTSEAPITDVEMQKTIAPEKPKEEVKAPEIVQDQTDSALTQEGLSGLEKKIGQTYMTEAQSQIKQNEATQKAYDDEKTGLIAQEKLVQDFQTTLKDLDTKNAQLSQDILNGKEDPNRYWSSKSTGSKVATIASMFLGALGAGAGGGPNIGIQAFDKAREEDIEAQRKDLGRKENMLSNNLKQYGNAIAAEAATRLQMSAILQGKIARAAAAFGSPAILAKAQRELFELQRQDIPLKQTLAKEQVKKTRIDALRQGKMDPMLVVNDIVEPADRPKAREEMAMIQGFKTAVSESRNLYNRARKIGIEGKIPFTTKKTEIDTIRQGINAKIRESMRGQGTITEPDQKFLIEPLLPNATDTNAQLTKKSEALDAFLANKVKGGTPTLSTYGIPVDTDLPSETKTLGGVQYQKVKGGWQKVK